MPDFRVADTAPEHPKMRAAGPAAIGLWAMAGAYSMNPSHLTDGWVPEHWVKTWPSGLKLATTLVKVGLWSRADRDGIAGYRFHDWMDTQRSASSIEDDKRKARDRMARARSKNVRPNKVRTSAATEAERSDEVRLLPHPHPHPEELEETSEAAPVGDPRPRGRGATGPHSASAYRLVDRVLGRRLTSGTRSSLAFEVSQLLAEATEDELAEALRRWNQRTGIGPRLLGALVDDLRKEARGATSRPAAGPPPVNATDAFAQQFLANGRHQPELRALPGGA